MGTASLDEVIAQRRALGQDRFDEVWEGEYRMVPGPSVAHTRVDAELVAALRSRARAMGLTPVTAFNVGTPRNYRVPDQGYLREPMDRRYVPTAEVLVEVLSPDDHTYAKFDFYATQGVREIIVADPATATIEIYALAESATTYVCTDRSELLGVTAAELTAEIDWPPHS